MLNPFEMLYRLFEATPSILAALATAAVVAVCCLIGGTIATAIATATIGIQWIRWETSDFNDDRLPLVGGMISCWQGPGWPYGWEWFYEAALNLLFFYRLAFLLPLAYLYLW